MREEFDDLARALARGALSRRQALARFGKLTGGAVLASIGLGAARAGADVVDPNASGQGFCARIRGEARAACITQICSTTCPEGFFGRAVCLQTVTGGPCFCGAVVLCAEAKTCASNADCGGGEFCAMTLCAEPQKCVPLCTSASDEPPSTAVTPALLRAAANGEPTTAG